MGNGASAVAALIGGSAIVARNAGHGIVSRAVTTCADNVVRLWEVGAWKPKGVLKGHTDCVCALAFSDEAAEYEVAKRACDRLVPFPDAADLPVIVMTRFSLSFGFRNQSFAEQLG